MDLIQLNLMEQFFALIQEGEIVGDLTIAVGPFEGERKRPVRVTIEEICGPEWSIGGSAMTTVAVPDFTAGKNITKYTPEEI